MKERFVVISLPNDDSYQQCQAKAAHTVAERYGVKLKLLYADNDAVTQSQQVLEIIQSGPKPDAVLVEPMTTTGLGRVAEAAVEAGIAWVVLNSEVEYLGRMRKLSSLPIFAVSIDQVEEILMSGFKTGLQPPERTVIDPQSYPPMQQLPSRRTYAHFPRST